MIIWPGVTQISSFGTHKSLEVTNVAFELHFKHLPYCV
jgi:hypothetical protein